MPFGTGVSPNGGTCTAPNAHPPAQESITPESCPYLGFGEEATHCASCKELQGLESTQGPLRLSAEIVSHWVLMFHPTGMLEPPPMELHLDQRLVLMGLLCPHCRYIPSEKIGQNFHPSESSFFVINYQQWTGRSAFRPFLALPDHLGGLGGPGGVMGGLKTLKMTLSLGDHFRP